MGKRKFVDTIRFTSTTQRHVCKSRSRTYCLRIINSKARRLIERRPARHVHCILCMKWSGILRRRKGQCLIARAPGRKPVHLVTRTNRKRQGRLSTPVGCDFDFTNYRQQVRDGTYADVTCGHCYWSCVEYP